MIYVIKRISDGYYVSRPGSKHSYTRYLENAQVFPSREAAQGDLCVESEVVKELKEVIHDSKRIQD